MNNLDFLGTNLYLFFNKSQKYKTSSGSFLSLIIIALGVLTFFYIGIDMFQRKKPSSYISIEKNQKPTLEVSDLFYAIQLTDTFFSPIKDIQRKFEYVFQILDGRANPPTFKNYEMVPCSQNSFYNQTNSALFTNWKFKTGNFFCIPDDVKYTIQGNYEDGLYSFASIFIQYYFFN